jgi:hypothetical protein
MNILVIGNGFDLAHGLKTTYQDFLKFTDNYRTYLENEYYEQMLEVKKLVHDNVWIKHFQRFCEENGWIGFEKEISKVIQMIEKKSLQFEALKEKGTGGVKFNFIEQAALEDFDSRVTQGTIFDIEFIPKNKDLMLDDLNRLIRCFEIYLVCYINNSSVKILSPDISSLSIDAVLSFNYTDTYSRIYNDSDDKEIEYDYIHGKANISNTIESNNMVLGIDEYLPDDRKDKDIEFIAFKKYYQRIYKQTGCIYKSWLQKIQRTYSIALQNEANYMDMMKTAYNKKNQEDMWNWYIASMINNQVKNEIHNIYIFGHSLDVTDGDVLRDLILNDNVKTTIFYHNRDAMGQQIANLVKIIGQDELIRRTGGSTKTIEFKMQKDMVPIEIENV